MKTSKTNLSVNVPAAGQDSDSAGLNRRRFVKGLGFAGASLLSAAGWMGNASSARAADHLVLSEGDAAILRFLAAAEIIETDLWVQYTELARGNKAYAAALKVIDDDNIEYIEENTNDETSHVAFLNAYLSAHGAEPVNFDAFTTLPSSTATGAKQIGRLTNLTKLNVDTSWYTRYRGTANPDLGGTFPQAVEIKGRPAIPLHDNYTKMEIQAIANVAAFHFAAIEQGGSSLYTHMAQNATSGKVVRIVVSIAGAEVFHFAIWMDAAGNAPALNTGDGLVFPNFEAIAALDPDDVMPKACDFLSTDLPKCSVIRPQSKELAGAMAAMNAFVDSGLFTGQSPAFFKALRKLALKADEAARDLS